MTVTQIALGCPPLADLATEAVQECVLQPNGAVPLWLDVQDPTDDDLDYLARTHKRRQASHHLSYAVALTCRSCS